MKKNNKITLFIMGRKGYECLRYIYYNFDDTIDKVITAPDSNIKHDFYKEIIAFCVKYKIKYIDKGDEVKIKTPYAFAVSWRWIIPNPYFKLVVFHDSLLPKYRGFNPLVSMLINGEKKIGVTALFASEKYDQGDIIAQDYTYIKYPIKINSAVEIVIENYKTLIKKVLTSIKGDGEIKTKRQINNDASYSLWRDEDDYRIRWDDDAKKIKQFIYAVSFPYKGASTMLKGTLLRIHDAEEINDVAIENRTPGKVIFIEEGCPVVVCGSGLLKIIDIRDNFDKQLLPIKKIRIRFQ